MDESDSSSQIWIMNNLLDFFGREIQITFKIFTTLPVTEGFVYT